MATERVGYAIPKRKVAWPVAVFAAAVLIVAAAPPSFAESDSLQGRDPTFNRGGGFFPFFRKPAPQPLPRQRVAPVQPRRAAPVIVRDDAIVPKVEIRHSIAVLGDSLANLVAGGLDEALSDRPDIAVLRKARADTGLVRSDFYDWRKASAEIAAGEPPVSLAVIMLGLNDRQAIREGDVVHEPLSERWLALYGERIDAVVAAFAARRIPLIWVGAPPVQNGRLSADLLLFNDLYRQRVERGGGHYVDLWGAFLDGENRYAAMGPDVSGQTMRLRLGDGIHFTKAGARKAAHFVDVVLRRLIEAAPAAPVIALPVAPSAGGALLVDPASIGIEQMIDRMVGVGPELSGLSPSLRARPLAGPIQPLTGQTAKGESALLTSIGAVRGRGDGAANLDRVFGDGIASQPMPGRLDDDRWPRR